MKKQETIVSVDIECTGPCPGLHSMISIGAVACIADETQKSGFRVVSEFSANLYELESGGMTEEQRLDIFHKHSTRDPQTMAGFWDKEREAWAEATKDPVEPEIAMKDFKKWLNNLPSKGRPVFCAYPAGFDWPFIYWYFHKLTGSCPFGFQCLDMKSYAHAILGKHFRFSTKRNMPKTWFPKNLPHTHIAIDDAREQAYLFFQMRRAATEVRNG